MSQPDGNCLLTYERLCPPSAAFFGAFGATCAVMFSFFGAAFGTAKAGLAVAHLGIAEPSKAMKGIVPIVMAGILGIYGLIIAVIISSAVGDGYGYASAAGFLHLGAGLAGGFASVAAGYVIGIVGDACCFAYRYTDKIFVAMVLMLIFAEALGLYGLIIALIMNSSAAGASDTCKKVMQDCPYASRKTG